MYDSAELLKAGYKHVDGAPKPPPISKPNFTLTELKAALPAHCFERSMATSFSYLARNLLICIVLFYGGYVLLEVLSLPLVVKVRLYLAYWFVQGSYMTGIWVIAHECGHNSFSENQIVNDIVGAILHSALLVPYHNWQISHRRHHSHTGSCENDEVFVPYTRSDVRPTWSETLEDSRIYNFSKIIALSVFSWMPGYLRGPKKYRDVSKSHFNPYAKLFLPNERLNVVLGDVELAAAVLILGYFMYSYGFALVFRIYLVPYGIVNMYLVLITFLHHTDTYIPHFRDRTFGKWIDGVINHIVDTHVCHHIFPKIPHYHAKEATEALIPLLGQYYLKDSTNRFVALWRAFTHCKFVPDDGKVVFYQKSM